MVVMDNIMTHEWCEKNNDVYNLDWFDSYYYYIIICYLQLLLNV